MTTFEQAVRAHIAISHQVRFPHLQALGILPGLHGYYLEAVLHPQSDKRLPTELDGVYIIVRHQLIFGKPTDSCGSCGRAFAS